MLQSMACAIIDDFPRRLKCVVDNEEGNFE